jgi:hypothetical protein
MRQCRVAVAIRGTYMHTTSLIIISARRNHPLHPPDPGIPIRAASCLYCAVANAELLAQSIAIATIKNSRFAVWSLALVFFYLHSRSFGGRSIGNEGWDIRQTRRNPASPA